MRVGYHSAGDDRHDNAAGLGGRFGLHRNFPAATPQRIGDAVGISEGAAGEGEERKEVRINFCILLDTPPALCFAGKPFPLIVPAAPPQPWQANSKPTCV